jgi:hypothetical protein
LGLLDFVEEKASEAVETVSETYEAASSEVASVAEDAQAGAGYVAGGLSEAVTNVEAEVKEVAQAGSEAVDHGPDIGTGLAQHWQTMEDTVGNNIVGFGLDLAQADKLNIPIPGIGALGKMAGPIGMWSSFKGMGEEIENSVDPGAGKSRSNFDANNFMSNFTGATGGMLSTVGMGAEAVGMAELGAAAAEGGSLVGSFAAGLLAGHGAAKATDSEYAQDMNKKTTWDYNTEGAARARNGINHTFGLEDDALPGNIAGGWLAATGAAPAAVIGAGNLTSNAMRGAVSGAADKIGA